MIVSGGAKERMALVHRDFKYYKHRALTRGQTMRRSDEFDQTPFVEELYDLIKDPGEKENVAGAYAEKIEFFRKEYERLMAKQGGYLPESVELDQETADSLKTLGYM